MCFISCFTSCVLVHVLDLMCSCFMDEGLPGVLGNKGTQGKYRREQGNMTPVLGNAGT